MAKFNPGDKVRVLGGKGVFGFGSGVPEGIYKYVGKTAWDTEYIEDTNGRQWAICEEEMEAV